MGAKIQKLNDTLLNAKGVFILLCVLLMVMLPSVNFSLAPPKDDFKIDVVVIDAGHGGHDPGTIGFSKTHEKNVALSVALKVGAYIKESYPDIKVIFTRDKDAFVELHERANIANKAKADLFISIHCNAFSSSTVHGTEVFVLGLHKSQDNLAVAQRENSVILEEDNHEQHYDGFDPKSPEAYILFNLMQNAYIDQSISFAQKVDMQFSDKVKRTSRGVKQAGFVVLYKSAMPSVLVELGFISNKNEETFLTTEEGQSYMASAIYRAFKEYKIEYEKNGPGGLTNTELPPVKEPTPDIPKATDKPKTDPPKTADKPKADPPKTDLPKTNTKPATTPPKDKVVFKIQFLASDKELATTAPELKKVDGWEVEKVGGLYKYLTGALDTYDAGLKLQRQVRVHFPSAFMVAYKNGVRITIKEATAQ
ncbi:N-acetylmuramoyl-L-alanine amidase [soil metagenome]